MSAMVPPSTTIPRHVAFPLGERIVASGKGFRGE
jgi:hypothetical protein